MGSARAKLQSIHRSCEKKLVARAGEAGVQLSNGEVSGFGGYCSSEDLRKRGKHVRD